MVEDPRLQEKSIEYIDDYNTVVEKRCFMLCSGKDKNYEPNFFRLEVSVDLFGDNREFRKKVDVYGQVNCMIMELSPKVVKSIA